VRVTPRAQRRLTVTVGVIAALLLVLGATAPATGAPNDPDGGNEALRAKLDEAAHAYNDAKGRLDASKAKQGQLEQGLLHAQLRLSELDDEVAGVAQAAYRGTRVNLGSVLLHGGAGSSSTGEMLHNAATVQFLAVRDDKEIRDQRKAQKDFADRKAAIDAEVKNQERQVAEMERRKQDAEKALGNPKPGTPVGLNQKASANPVPRSANGTLPGEGCTEKDPTTSGCLSPRALNALQQARAAGFNHFTACFRSGGGGDHPKGKACDFAANPSGFQNARAAGADKAYGDQLAGWFIANADRLGVAYVIWYKQVWFPGSGWKAYTSGDGTPAGDHYNHVHLSVS
jgi:hypothetical protein